MSDLENDKKDSVGLSKEDLETLFESTFQKMNETKKKSSNNDQIPPFLEAKNSQKNQVVKQDQIQSTQTSKKINRSRSSLRLKYEAEIQVIKKSIGDIEDVRRQLGLSKRKMAQLLLVDPSAWTRWTKNGEVPPPHIYRALQWYMILQEKHPELRSSIWLNAVAQPQISRHEIESIKSSILRDFSGFESKIQSFDEGQILSTTLKSQLDKAKIQIVKLNQKLKAILIIQALFILLYLLFKLL